MSGSDTQAKGYDTAGQLTSHTLSAGSISYTHDPEGSPLTEVITNNATASSGQLINTVTNTFNVRGELVDNSAADLGPPANADELRVPVQGDDSGRPVRIRFNGGLVA